MYEVTGDANGVTITMLNDSGGVDQGNYMLPFRYMGSFPNDTAVFSISARIIDPKWGSPEITCRIATYAITLRPGLKVEATATSVVVAGTPEPLSAGDFLMELGGMATEIGTDTKATAKAVGYGNTATCLWEYAES